jgi:hypothetical protein
VGLFLIFILINPLSLPTFLELRQASLTLFPKWERGKILPLPAGEGWGEGILL